MRHKADLTPSSRWKARVVIPLLLSAAAGAALSAVALWAESKLLWTPLQRQYFAMYLHTRSSPGPFRAPVLTVEYRKGRRAVATDADVTPVAMAQGEESLPAFRLSSAAEDAGALRVTWRGWKQLSNAGMHGWFQHRIFAGRPVWEVVRFSVWTGVVGFFVMFVAIVSGGRRRRRELERGRIVQGPKLVTRAEFNRRRKSDGIGFATKERVTAGELLAAGGTPHRQVRIPRQEESQHMLLMGDTGAGKSSLIRQLLTQIAERGETAVVYDPALEYTPHFYQPSRGDQILNPLDERMPYWAPGEEVIHAAEALTVAKGLFPDRPRETQFFIESARKVFAHLIRFNPAPHELSTWLRNPQEIDKRLVGTELAALVDARAPGQRSGVLASLSLAGDAFELLPSEAEGQGRWSAAAWSGTRRGWLFFPSSHEVRERLLPVVSLWLDLVILRLIRQAEGTNAPVWVVLDELASLQKLPQLATALAEGRKANVRLVIGFQGRSQLEARYGTEAETMLSQPKTKVFLRTSEPKAAEWISKAIGEVEVERLRESISNQQRNFWSKPGAATSNRSRQTELKVEPLVMSSVISGLPDLTGYIKSQDLAIQATFPYVGAERRSAGFLRRDMTTVLPSLLRAESGDPDVGPVFNPRSIS